MESKNEREIFFTAIWDGNIEKVKEMIQNGINVNITSPSGINALMLTVSSGHEKTLEISKILVEKGINIQVADQDNWTALFKACLYKRFDVIRYLLKIGVNPKTKCVIGKSPFSYVEAIPKFRLLFAKYANLLDEREHLLLEKLRFKVKFN